MTNPPLRTYNKLIRDKQLDFIRADGLVPNWRIIQGDELLQALACKLVEEANEVAKEIIGHRLDRVVGDTAPGVNRHIVIREIADLVTVAAVLVDILDTENGSRKTQEAIVNKAAVRGLFDQGIFLESISLADPREAEDVP